MADKEPRRLEDFPEYRAAFDKHLELQVKLHNAELRVTEILGEVNSIRSVSGSATTVQSAAIAMLSGQPPHFAPAEVAELESELFKLQAERPVLEEAVKLQRRKRDDLADKLSRRILNRCGRSTSKRRIEWRRPRSPWSRRTRTSTDSARS